MDQFLLTAFLFLVAGVVSVPVATRLGLGSVLGYLIAGIALGPVLHGLDVDVAGLQHFAEFGVVMMLFLVGLELEPKLLWQMRARLAGLGGLQVAMTTAAVTAVVTAFGQPAAVGLATGLILALSSTAIVLQTLNEKGLLRSDGGQASFAVLLFQDIAVIPMLAFLPLLALPELAGAGAHAASEGAAAHGMGLTEGLPGWAKAAVTLGAIAAVVVGGSYLTRPIFRFITVARLRELFTATALLIVIAIALLMTLVGLSPALGTFLAGVVLANSEYRHELESDIAPFKGLLLGLFFMTVGARIDFGLLAANLALVVALAVGLILLKAAVLFVLAVLFRLAGSDRWLFALGLSQAGEFGFVLIAFALASRVLPQPVVDLLLLVVALTMLLTPLLFILYGRLIVPGYAAAQAEEADEIDVESGIIIAGHGRFGGIVNRMLRAAGYEPVVLDYSSAQLEMLRAFGMQVFFGDATRPDLLHAAGIERAKLLVIAIDDKEQTTKLTRFVVQAYPHVHVIARAWDRNHVYELYGAGCRDIIRETFDGAVRTGRSALEALGIHPYEADLRSRDFVARDKYATFELAQLYDPEVPIHLNAAYVARAREIREQTEAELRGDVRAFNNRAERGWTPPSSRDLDASRAAALRKNTEL